MRRWRSGYVGKAKLTRSHSRTSTSSVQWHTFKAITKLPNATSGKCFRWPSRFWARSIPEYALALNNVARMEIERRAYGQAVPRLREAVAIQEAARGPRTEELVFPLLNLAVALRGIGKERAAEAPLRQARTIAVATKHPFLGMTMVELADVRCDLGDRASALQLLQDARRSLANSSGTEPWQMAWLELVDAQCRKLPVPANVRAAILARWKPVTHYGWRAAHSSIAG